METPRCRETGRPPTAQFAPRAVYIQEGSATRCGKKVTRVVGVAADLIAQGAGRGRRGVPRADRAVPAGAAGALLPDARILPGRRGRPAGHAAGRLAGPRRVPRSAPRCAPGCTRSPPTGASTRCARPAGDRPRSGTCPRLNRPSRPGSARSSGCSRIPTPSWRGAGAPPGPEARYEQAEAISLAFVTALQVLPPRQVAVLILRDVLGFHASEVADMLDLTVESVTSALKRARASLQRRLPPADGREPPPAAGSPAEEAIVAKFVSAWESADLDALVALLTDDVFMSMPPMPFEYEGRDIVARLLRQPVRRGPQVRPRPDASQRPAGVRRLPARPRRHPPRDRPVRADPGRRPDLRHDPLRGQRAAMVRATAIAPEPVAALPGGWSLPFQPAEVRGSSPATWSGRAGPSPAAANANASSEFAV